MLPACGTFELVLSGVMGNALAFLMNKENSRLIPVGSSLLTSTISFSTKASPQIQFCRPVTSRWPDQAERSSTTPCMPWSQSCSTIAPNGLFFPPQNSLPFTSAPATGCSPGYCLARTATRCAASFSKPKTPSSCTLMSLYRCASAPHSAGVMPVKREPKRSTHLTNISPGSVQRTISRKSSAHWSSRRYFRLRA